jgi:hypothetical protein
MPKKHFLDQLAEEWRSEEEKFFLDVNFSQDYFHVTTPLQKKTVYQIDDHDIGASKNLSSLFNLYYRKETHKEHVGLYPMVREMFENKTFAPKELDFGKVTLYKNVQPTDLISGMEGNMGDQGWVVSKKLLEILQSFNIGKYQTYSIGVKSKNNYSNDYVYLHYYAFADEFVDYTQSKFYKQAGMWNYESRTLISIPSFPAIKETENLLNEGIDIDNFDNRVHIRPKEIFLKENTLDLFKFDTLKIIECFMSDKLRQTLLQENITGLEISQTTKVKNSILL